MITIMNRYVHGYSQRETERLIDQARTLTDLLHHDTHYLAGCYILEAGCGIGAQTIPLAQNSPKSKITSIDISESSIGQAKARISVLGISNVDFGQADIYSLPFADETFDHIFACFVLEHISDPLRALSSLRRVLKSNGTITVIEGDHGSAYFSPDSEAARNAINCLVVLQRAIGGNALIGRELYPLLSSAGFQDVTVSPRLVYIDASHPSLIEGFTKHTFIAMVEGVRDEALQRGMIRIAEWERGIHDLYRTCEPDGTFCYTFFKGTGIK